MAEQWLDTTHNACREVSNEAYGLQALAQAFYLTGNTIVSGELQQASEVLLEAQKRILAAIGEYLHDQVKKDQEQTSLLIQTVLKT